MSRDVYREWSYQDRLDNYRDKNFDDCRKYDNDRDSGERAYEEWRNGGNFEDPIEGNRFS